MLEKWMEALYVPYLPSIRCGRVSRLESRLKTPRRSCVTSGGIACVIYHVPEVGGILCTNLPNPLKYNIEIEVIRSSYMTTVMSTA